jgi:hypothetical protein
MAKFKKGDRVIALDSTGNLYHKGDLGTVDEDVTGNDNYPWVKWDKVDGEFREDDGRFAAYEDDLELFKDYKTKGGKVNLLKIYVDCLGSPDLKLAVWNKMHELGANKSGTHAARLHVKNAAYIDELLQTNGWGEEILIEKGYFKISLDEFFALTKDDVVLGEEPEIQEIDIEEIKKKFGVTGEFKIKGLE